MLKSRNTICVIVILFYVISYITFPLNIRPIDAQEPTATIAPPKIKTLPPSSISPTQVLTMTEEPSDTPSITVTPNPEFAGLDEAVNNTFAVKSLKFSLFATLDIETNGEIGTLTLETEGSAANFSDPQKFVLQTETKTILELGGNTQTVIVQQRFVDGVIYFQAHDPNGTRATEWYGIKFEDIFADIISFDPSKIDAAEIVEKINIDKFIRVRRTDSSGDNARYEARIDVQKFLRSKEFLDLIDVMIALGEDFDIGLDLEEIRDKIQEMAPLMNVIVPVLVPIASVRITSTTQSNPALLKEVEFDIEIEVTPLENLTSLMSGNADSGEAGEPITVTIFATIEFFDFGSDVIVEVPADVHMIESLDQLAGIVP